MALGHRPLGLHSHRLLVVNRLRDRQDTRNTLFYSPRPVTPLAGVLIAICRAWIIFVIRQVWRCELMALLLPAIVSFLFARSPARNGGGLSAAHMDSRARSKAAMPSA